MFIFLSIFFVDNRSEQRTNLKNGFPVNYCFYGGPRDRESGGLDGLGGLQVNEPRRGRACRISVVF